MRVWGPVFGIPNQYTGFKIALDMALYGYIKKSYHFANNVKLVLSPKAIACRGITPPVFERQPLFPTFSSPPLLNSLHPLRFPLKGTPCPIITFEIINVLYFKQWVFCHLAVSPTTYWHSVRNRAPSNLLKFWFSACMVISDMADTMYDIIILNLKISLTLYY